MLATEQITKRILIVDDHPVLRHGLGQVINQQVDLTVCAEAETAQEALRWLETDAADVILVDISLKDSNGLDLIQRIKETHTDARILVLSAHDESRFAERALQMGALGYIMKDESIEQILKAIRQVIEGNVYLSDKLMPKLMTRLINGEPRTVTSPAEVLSNREFEVFQMIGEGMRTRDIAARLDLSPKTIQVYREHIKRKLKLADSVALHQTAFDWVRNENGI